MGLLEDADNRIDFSDESFVGARLGLSPHTI